MLASFAPKRGGGLRPSALSTLQRLASFLRCFAPSRENKQGGFEARSTNGGWRFACPGYALQRRNAPIPNPASNTPSAMSALLLVVGMAVVVLAEGCHLAYSVRSELTTVEKS